MHLGLCPRGVRFGSPGARRRQFLNWRVWLVGVTRIGVSRASELIGGRGILRFPGFPSSTFSFAGFGIRFTTHLRIFFGFVAGVRARSASLEDGVVL